MIQMRWLHYYVHDDNGGAYEKKKLQYRQEFDPTVRAGWSDEIVNHMFPTPKKLEWSEWTDVPIVWEDKQ